MLLNFKYRQKKCKKDKKNKWKLMFQINFQIKRNQIKFQI